MDLGNSGPDNDYGFGLVDALGAYNWLSQELHVVGLGGATLESDLDSPQLVGTPQVIFTAEGSGGSGSYEYRFWLDSGSGWTIEQEYSASNTWTCAAISCCPITLS